MYKKRIPVDPVWSPRHYPVQFSTHSVEKSLEMHRELADPSMMDDMNKYVYLELRFDTEITKEVMVKGGKKETKVSYLESISDYLKFPHMFETKEKRRVMVFCKPEEVELALSNGAEIAGGKELADQVDNNEIDWKNMDVILGTVDALPDILSVRKKIKNKLPTQKSGTLGVDLVEMLKKHTDGIGMTSFPVKANISIMKVKVGTVSCF
ncbi:39S ribosomal protein L1, mitochondrial-like [Lingula anatina]|uniref:39S ribosomal protein L1, mitochondrial-like n=1 Tax=Lingula anatina TaxID=7574 RepID=A0A2R2MTX7_LINAN|nr:39S ribosomal protein L1, mitochondrial-like [Lingula anatina]|eukprot:XP_023933701.1 39S ribosomal protein L1, mitochondrial-like [Lingula anatina]